MRMIFSVVTNRGRGSFVGSWGVARPLLNPRLIAGIPLGWLMLGGVVAGVSGPGGNGGGAGQWWRGSAGIYGC